MYEEDKIFGPLTFKQFLCFAAGAFAVYLAYTKMSPPASYIAYAIILLSTLLAIKRFDPKKIPIENLEAHLKSKRGGKSNTEYAKLLKLYRARIQSYMAMRELKGLESSADFVEANRIIEKLIAEISS